jgi:hypothetical protein
LYSSCCFSLTLAMDLYKYSIILVIFIHFIVMIMLLSSMCE